MLDSKTSGREIEFPFPGKRIAIIAATGSGKTTLAKQLSETLGLDLI